MVVCYFFLDKVVRREWSLYESGWVGFRSAFCVRFKAAQRLYLLSFYLFLGLGCVLSVSYAQQVIKPVDKTAPEGPLDKDVSLDKEVSLDKKEVAKELYFDLLDWGQVTDVESGKLMVDGVRLKFRPFKGEINQTTTRFGITDEDMGSAGSLIDGKSYVKGDKPESLAMYFSQAVEVLEIRLSSFTEDGKNSERAKLEIAGLEFELVARPEGQDIYQLKNQHNESVKLAKMERFTLTWVHGNGFSLDGVKVRTIPKKGSLD